MENNFMPALNEAVWYAIAGEWVHRIPAVDSLVYYYPEGHLAQNGPPIPRPPGIPVRILCRVVSVGPLSYVRGSEQPVVRFALRPVPPEDLPPLAAQVIAPPANQDLMAPPLQAHIPPPANQDLPPAPQDLPPPAISCIVKVLRYSDTGNRCILPVNCSKYLMDGLPGDSLTVTDPSGIGWEFGLRNNNHLTGWKFFSDDKNLIEGDTLVLKRAGDTVYVGVRKKNRDIPVGARDHSIAEMRNAALEGGEFTVYYFPAYGFSDFVIDANRVDSVSLVVGKSVRKVAQPQDGPLWTPDGIIKAIADVIGWKSVLVKWGNGLEENVNAWEIREI